MNPTPPPSNLSGSWSASSTNTTATLASQYEGSSTEIKRRIQALLRGAEKRVRTNTRLSLDHKRKIYRNFHCHATKGCTICPAAAVPTKPGLSRAKKKQKTLHQPRSLKALSLRTILESRALPSQFENALEPNLCSQVWLHMPMIHISALRMFRVYGAFYIDAVSGDDRPIPVIPGSSGCNCPTEIWLDSRGTGISRLRITLCAICMGFSRGMLKHLEKCPNCQGLFGACGCNRCIHMIIDAYFDEARILRKLELHSNRSGWWTLGSALMVAEGYPHGMISWNRMTPIRVPQSMVIFPENAAFHCGIFHTGRILEDHVIPNHHQQQQQQQQQTNAKEQQQTQERPHYLIERELHSMTLQMLMPLDPTTSCLDSKQLQGWRAISRASNKTSAGIRIVKETAVPCLPDNSTGFDLFHALSHWAATSFSVGLFVRAARIYMINALGEQTKRPQSEAAIRLIRECAGPDGAVMLEFANLPKTTSRHYSQIYKASKATDWPQDIGPYLPSSAPSRISKDSPPPPKQNKTSES